MKKIVAMVLCLVLLFSLVSCGAKDKINGDTTIQIGEVIYYNTKEAIPAEPDESVIVYVEPTDVSCGNDKITCYAFINEDTIEGKILLGKIDGEWYKFLPKQVTTETDENKSNTQYYLTVGAENVYSIEYSVLDLEPMGIGQSDAPFEKGKVIVLEGLTGCPDLRGLKITAFDEMKNVIWTAEVPNSDNEGFTHLQEDDWNITDLGTRQ